MIKIENQQDVDLMEVFIKLAMSTQDTNLLEVITPLRRSLITQAEQITKELQEKQQVVDKAIEKTVTKK